MKNKLIFIFIVTFCVCHRSAAQLKHYFNLNIIGHYEFFNQEKDRNIGQFAPNYKVEKDKWGLEIFYNWRGVGYYRGATSTPENLNKEGAILQIISSNIGAACHYKLLDKKYINISSIAGLVKNWYDATHMALLMHSGGWIEGYPTHDIESRFGVLAGVNINIPIWKSIYLNTNTRYMVFPSAQYNKQNLVFDFGLGYRYQNKAKKK
jgi:hypothetical protein